MTEMQIRKEIAWISQMYEELLRSGETTTEVLDLLTWKAEELLEEFKAIREEAKNSNRHGIRLEETLGEFVKVIVSDPDRMSYASLGYFIYDECPCD